MTRDSLCGKPSTTNHECGIKVKPPHRRLEMTFKISADSWKELVAHILSRVNDFDGYGEPKEGDPPLSGSSGGCGTGDSWYVEVDHAMTHDRYIEELHAYLETVRAHRRES